MTQPSRPMGPLHGDAGDQPYAAGSASHHGEHACLFPGCERPAVGSHSLGGPPSMFCDLEEHNALTVHLENRRITALHDQKETDDGR